ncbi:MAG: 2-dehydro-3-deoxy-6-phosphogalactonate aldolase [Rhodospirillales bacterium]|nr:2-dehydro-3-deoxy-6-phosphogalactonate aldolase [Rhodospirillales bacterium]
MTDIFDSALAAMPLVAVLRGITPDEAIPVADALTSAGFTILEVTLNSPDPFNSIAQLVKHCADDVLVGAGTVLEAEQTDRLAALGAKLVITPNTDVEVIRGAVRNKLIPVIGCMTPSEALLAMKTGARAIKVFPAARLGAAYLKDISAVLPTGTQIIPTGGVTTQNMKEFFDAGAAGAGLGSNLYKAGRPADEIHKIACELVAEWRRISA